VIRNFLKLIYR